MKFLWRSICLAAVISVCLAASARAQAPLTYTWINPATGGVWSDPSQWADINADGTGDVADGANNTANFGTLDLTANNTDHDGCRSHAGESDFRRHHAVEQLDRECRHSASLPVCHRC